MFYFNKNNYSYIQSCIRVSSRCKNLAKRIPIKIIKSIIITINKIDNYNSFI
jgi:hypothetical protein